MLQPCTNSWRAFRVRLQVIYGSFRVTSKRTDVRMSETNRRQNTKVSLPSVSVRKKLTRNDRCNHARDKAIRDDVGLSVKSWYIIFRRDMVRMGRELNCIEENGECAKRNLMKIGSVIGEHNTCSMIDIIQEQLDQKGLHLYEWQITGLRFQALA